MSGKKLGRNPFEKKLAAGKAATPAPAKVEPPVEPKASAPNRSRVLHAEARASSKGKARPGEELPRATPGQSELAEWASALSAGLCLLGLRAALIAYDAIFPEKRRT